MMLELRDIYKIYLQGKLEVPVLNGISLSVEEGEYLAIMGPSGSGKTTLMNIIGCLDNPSSGDYILDGENIAKFSEKRMSEVRLHSIGFVFQSFYLLSKQSALENVALPLLYAGVRRRDRLDIARRALERVGLGDRTDFTPTQLSGGQCQRVAIARAIVNNPKILLADEPTGALDTRSGEQIMEIFQRLNQEGVTVVMITHEPEIAAHARRILHIRDGLLVGGNGSPSRQPPQAAPAEPMKEIVSVSPRENIKGERTTKAAPLPKAPAAAPITPATPTVRAAPTAPITPAMPIVRAAPTAPITPAMPIVRAAPTAPITPVAPTAPPIVSATPIAPTAPNLKRNNPMWIKPLPQAIPIPPWGETPTQWETRHQAPEPKGMSEPGGKSKPEEKPEPAGKPEEPSVLSASHPDDELISVQNMIAALQRQSEQLSGQEAAREEVPADEQ